MGFGCRPADFAVCCSAEKSVSHVAAAQNDRFPVVTNRQSFSRQQRCGLSLQRRQPQRRDLRQFGEFLAGGFRSNVRVIDKNPTASPVSEDSQQLQVAARADSKGLLTGVSFSD